MRKSDILESMLPIGASRGRRFYSKRIFLGPLVSEAARQVTNALAR